MHCWRSPLFRFSRDNMPAGFCCTILPSSQNWVRVGRIPVMTSRFFWNLQSSWSKRVPCSLRLSRVDLPVRSPARAECSSWVSPLNLIKSGESMYALIWPPCGAFGFEKVPTKYLRDAQGGMSPRHKHGVQKSREVVIRTLTLTDLCFSAAWNIAKPDYLAHNQCLKTIRKAYYMLQR